MTDPIQYAGKKYCTSLLGYHRFLTREVMVGKLGIGANNPIRLQSMTTTDTMHTQKTVEQSIRMIEAGCELVRITAPSKNEALNLEKIKNELHNKGYFAPLVADIHFTPNAAEIAARIVEKVRVNPGNYADKKKFEELDYSQQAYDAELKRIKEKFSPLVAICKQHKTAMRIGTNHGSLSDRIMSFYGDTPLGMVESAMEFLRVCREMDYHDIVLSMKASNPQVMVQAYRLLVAKMIKENMNYPLHLGVTEAGDGEDGRIKSAVGIGALLEDGLGDTIRVSLTEDPEFEIPVAKLLADRYSNRKGEKIQSSLTEEEALEIFHPFVYEKRHSIEINNLGGKNVPRVVADFSNRDTITAASLFAVGYNYHTASDKWNLTDQACDFIFAGDITVDFEIPGSLGVIHSFSQWIKQKHKDRRYPLFSVEEFNTTSEIHPLLNFIRISHKNFTADFLKSISVAKNIVLVFYSEHESAVADMRLMFLELKKNKIEMPVIIHGTYTNLNDDAFMLYASTDAGSLFVDGFGDGVWLSPIECSNPQLTNRTAFGILQATRTRISKTEYIACPSCGRTLFDLQETTQKIRSRTSHLKGIKIGIMGCIVNGPGEMADADYGYVGTGVGKISLYKGKEVVKKNVASEKAVDELINLIKEHGDWVEEIKN